MAINTAANKRVASRVHASGFTLVEVMVALFVVVFALSALMLKTMTIVDSTAYLHNKTVAHWVALNQLELARLSNQQSNQLLTEQTSGEQAMVGQQWFWRIKPIKTANNGFMQLQVSVGLDRELEQPIVTVMGMIDRYHGGT